MITFTIDAPTNSLTTTPVGRLPGGFRIQLDYGSLVTFSGTSSGTSSSGAVAKPFNGKVASGMDWIFLRDDGAAIFDAHITFQSLQPEHYFDAVLSGQIDITSLAPGAPWMPIEAPGDWQKLAAAGDLTLTVALPIAFRTSVGKAALGGRKLSKAIEKATENATLFAELGRNQFVAHGGIVIAAGLIKSLRLTVVDLATYQQASPKPTRAQNGAARKSNRPPAGPS
jgi:hypothetical protein